jgi:hypothetical protein
VVPHLDEIWVRGRNLRNTSTYVIQKRTSRNRGPSYILKLPLAWQLKNPRNRVF